MRLSLSPFYNIQPYRAVELEDFLGFQLRLLTPTPAVLKNRLRLPTPTPAVLKKRLRLQHFLKPNSDNF